MYFFVSHSLFSKDESLEWMAVKHWDDVEICLQEVKSGLLHVDDPVNTGIPSETWAIFSSQGLRWGEVRESCNSDHFKWRTPNFWWVVKPCSTSNFHS